MSAVPSFTPADAAISRIDAAMAERSGKASGSNLRDHGDRAPLRKLEWISAADLGVEDRVFDDELVEGVIGKAAMAVLYGDSNSGKTFFAIDIAASVEQGCRWMGRHCAGGLVLYLATEAVASVELRVAAYRRRHGVSLAGVIVVRSPVNFFDGAADAGAVVALVDEVERHFGQKVVLVIGDTLARISAGANENSGEDMSAVFRHADRIIRDTGASFLWIHHVGKDAARGMRGWSGMRAHIDTEIEITAGDATGIRTAELTKQRDLPGKGERIGFRLDSVPMGRNQWGTERTSAVVVQADAPAKVAKGKRPGEIAGAITEFLLTRGTGCLRGALAKHFDGRYHRASIYKEINKMLDSGLLIEAAGIVAMPGRPGVNA